MTALQGHTAIHHHIPGTRHWPRFVRNRSEQFEARLSLVRINESPSLFFSGMSGNQLPIATSHGEGRAEFNDENDLERLIEDGCLALQFVNNYGQVATRYPANPNGSPEGLAGLTSIDGRVTAIMPHPERVFRAVQCSWAPTEWGEDGAWMRLFRNARRWVD